MEITPEHPVYVEGQGWLNAENLAIGDRLRRADGGMAKVLSIERVKLNEPQPVYNFTVKGPHTYFVLDVGVLVHNCGPSSCPWPGRHNASGNPAVGPYDSRSDVTLEQLEEFYLKNHHLEDSYCYQWTDGLDRLFGRMSPEQVMQFRAWVQEHGTFSVVGGFGETLDGALTR